MANFDETFDWVVVGCGGGSMSSALLMRQAGKSVVILEKSPFAGGTTCKSGGVMWLPNNPFMDPGEDSTEKGITYLDAVVGDDADAPGTSHEKRLAYITEGRKMVEFLVKQGVQLRRGSVFWPDYYDEYPGGCKTSRTIVAEPFDKNELGEWAPKLRKGFLEVPVLLDDGMKLPFMTTGKKIGFFAKTGLKVVLGKLTGKSYVTAGAALQGRMLKAALGAGVDIRVETPVNELIIENGKVVGVVASKDGKPWRVGANLGVLVNAGGFSRNQEMRDKYMPGTNSAWSMTNEADEGDMHREMERHGGVLAQMDQMVGFQMTRAPGWEDEYVAPGAQSITAKPHAILVDQTGVRYLNEGGSYEEYCERMVVRNRTAPAVPSWAVFDRQYLELYPLANGGQGKIPQKWVETGYLKQAATIEELAKLIDVDPATLKATVDRWNGFVDKGVDEDFHRGERAYDEFLGDPRREKQFRSLGRIDKGPFYAVDVVPGDVSTYGGVITDVNSRVLRGDGSAIEGLYATGVSTASPMGKVYPGAGASVGPSLTFGWIAAKHAAGLSNAQL
ncbi:FAD-binding protein [Novosphingobium sp. JCM 18896]|uniref:FAD-binding protein n=1 Tax=Novosphingobium sp. JCM 18896 TaxID=2989731 RepID=UPI00222221C2|nr:FAD-binding protein [Novosphingobium sp. JCM 18896]MCW1428182.1 FAD-dependent oxidoreductase [Novosphingobium sp. JCM 18896]